MRKVALTGGIATGKSYVLERFLRLGVPCLDADALAHGVLVAGTEVTSAIVARFGHAVLDEKGAVDRRRLGAIVFSDEQARRDLEALVHPAVRRAMAVGLKAFERTGQVPFAIVAIPLLYETGGQRGFDLVIATHCPRSVQFERLRSRGLTHEEAEQRLAAQVPVDEKAARADVVIETDGTFAETDAQVDRLFHQLSEQTGAV